MSDFIQNLVVAKLGSGVIAIESTNGSEPTESEESASQKKNEVDIEVAWQQLAAEPLYMLELEIITGVKQSLAIAGQDLCLDSELVEDLAGGYRSKISKKLVKLRGKLESMQKAFYRRHTIYASPFRFVREDSLPDAIAHLEDMQDQAAEYCRELAGDYADQVASFLLDISRRLEKAVPEDDLERDDRIEAALIGYAEDFPSLEDFESSLGISIKGPIKLASLAEQLKKDRVFQTELAREEKTAASVRLETQRIEAQRKAQKLLQNNLLNAFESSKDACMEEGYELLGQFLDRADARQAGQMTSRDSDALVTLFERLELLASHTGRLQPMLEEARKLRLLYLEENPDTSEVQDATEAFQNFLLSQASKEQSSSSQGLQKLTRSLAFSADYKQLMIELTALANRPDSQRLTELEGKIHSDLDVLKLRQSKLQKAFRSAKEALEAKAKIEPSESFDSPYDSVAGF